MSIRSTILAAAFTLASWGTAHADGLKPFEAQSIHLGDLSGELQLVGCRLLVSQPDQFRGCANELLIELIQAAIAAERHDRVELSLNRQDVAAVLCGDMASHWCERGELIELTLNVPDFRGAEGPELLEGNRLQ